MYNKLTRHLIRKMNQPKYDKYILMKQASDKQKKVPFILKIAFAMDGRNHKRVKGFTQLFHFLLISVYVEQLPPQEAYQQNN